jgi:hypothetical protein
VLLAHGRTPLVAIAMGHAGTVSRIAFPAAGSLLTYASADGEEPTAPGQLPLRMLRRELARYYPGYGAARGGQIRRPDRKPASSRRVRTLGTRWSPASPHSTRAKPRARAPSCNRSS